MSIPREQLDTLDFDDVAEAHEAMAPVTPGEILRDEFMIPLGLSGPMLAAALHVTPARVAGVVSGKSPIRPDMALRLARYFSTSPESWLNLQQQYELTVARRIHGRTIASEVVPRAA